MLKRRIIPIQLVNGARLVKSVRFDDFRDVGDPVQSAAVYNAQNADELMILNVARADRSIQPLAKVIAAIAERVFMPLSAGGGIASEDDAAFLIKHGADKVVINSAAYRAPDLISRIADRYGAQAVVVAIDASAEHGSYVAWSDCARQRERVSITDHIARVIAAGAGEIMVQSVDRDGMRQGFDLDLLRLASLSATVPVIGAGGSGHYDHLKEAFLESDVSALACGSLFNFSDSNPMRAKAYLSNYGLKFKVI